MSLDDRVSEYWTLVQDSVRNAHDAGWEGIQTIRYIIILIGCCSVAFNMVTLILSQPVWDTGWIVLITAAIVITGFAVYLLTIVFAPVIGYGRLAYRNRKQPIIGPTFKKKETNMFGDE